ncbi:uncharacterized protein LOC119089013 [Peromyscus leucopus]|uniref:uncharacterized protein LOC119089013 n=1 Tax=Peromyscus leucopus TaxID=10041 RepID=UPI00188530C5|nr:uncharacterized protein LOC119089013 [Peromyscus leucopus]XP_037066689.1 uncharacterized protein LOC119089013 [Peromyscus leucopus]XP_037066690.1 uncharacterized protein LOC119089013 [Peromyscus leucopus]
MLTKQMMWTMMTWLMLITGAPMVIKGHELWAILKAWPFPMPLTSQSGVFPFIFTTNESLGWPHMPMDKSTAPNNFTLASLEDTLCFSTRTDNVTSNPCIVLHRQALGRFEFPNITGNKEVGNASIFLGTTPRAVGKGNGTSPLGQPSVLPRCVSKPDWPPVWTGCQGGSPPNWININKTLSLSLKGTPHNNTFSGYNYSFNNPVMTTQSNPFDSWVMCGPRGACSQLNALGFVDGGSFRRCNYYFHSGEIFETNVTVQCNKIIDFKPTPVCVWPPFLMIVFNYSQTVLNCSSQKCILTQCWSASEHDAMVIVRVPMYIPFPARVMDDELPVLLSRHKRDFGITAAIVTAIAVSATAAAVAAASLATAVPTAKALNTLSGSTAQALYTQMAVNMQLQRGIVLLNQRVDLLQEQIDILQQVITAACVVPMSGLCLTTVQYNNFSRAANYSKYLSALLTGTWNAEFDNLTNVLRAEIIMINST